MYRFTLLQAKCTYGTGAFLLMNTGQTCIPSTSGLLTTVAYKLGENRPCYALEGSVAYAGLLIQWLRDNLHMVASAKECEELARSVPDNGGVFFVPAFSGLYAPYWYVMVYRCIVMVRIEVSLCYRGFALNVLVTHIVADIVFLISCCTNTVELIVL